MKKKQLEGEVTEVNVEVVDFKVPEFPDDDGVPLHEALTMLKLYYRKLKQGDVKITIDDIGVRDPVKKLVYFTAHMEFQGSVPMRGDKLTELAKSWPLPPRDKHGKLPRLRYKCRALSKKLARGAICRAVLLHCFGAKNLKEVKIRIEANHEAEEAEKAALLLTQGGEKAQAKRKKRLLQLGPVHMESALKLITDPPEVSPNGGVKMRAATCMDGQKLYNIMIERFGKKPALVPQTMLRHCLLPDQEFYQEPTEEQLKKKNPLSAKAEKCPGPVGRPSIYFLIFEMDKIDDKGKTAKPKPKPKGKGKGKAAAAAPEEPAEAPLTEDMGYIAFQAGYYYSKKAIYIEDIFVKVRYRRQHVAKQAVLRVAALTLAVGAANLVWRRQPGMSIAEVGMAKSLFGSLGVPVVSEEYNETMVQVERAGAVKHLTKYITQGLLKPGEVYDSTPVECVGLGQGGLLEDKEDTGFVLIRTQPRPTASALTAEAEDDDDDSDADELGDDNDDGGDGGDDMTEYEAPPDSEAEEETPAPQVGSKRGAPSSGGGSASGGPAKKAKGKGKAK